MRAGRSLICLESVDWSVPPPRQSPRRSPPPFFQVPSSPPFAFPCPTATSRACGGLIGPGSPMSDWAQCSTAHANARRREPRPGQARGAACVGHPWYGVRIKLRTRTPLTKCGVPSPGTGPLSFEGPMEPAMRHPILNLGCAARVPKEAGCWWEHVLWRDPGRSCDWETLWPTKRARWLRASANKSICNVSQLPSFSSLSHMRTYPPHTPTPPTHTPHTHHTHTHLFPPHMLVGPAKRVGRVSKGSFWSHEDGVGRLTQL